MSNPYVAATGGILYYVAHHYHYGNCGGEYWSGGVDYSKSLGRDSYPINTNAPARQGDPLDEIYKQHDIAYYNINRDFIAHSISEIERNARINDADRALADGYRNLDLSSVYEQYRTEAAIHGSLAANYYTLEIAAYEAGKAIPYPGSVPFGLSGLAISLIVDTAAAAARKSISRLQS